MVSNDYMVLKNCISTTYLNHQNLLLFIVLELPLMKILKSLIRLMRTYQWVKNGMIFFPVFFAVKIDQLGLLLNAVYAFVGFSLVASAVYIFNDLHDVREDRLHPIKKFRPLAASEISSTIAKVLLLVLLVAGISVIYFPLNILKISTSIIP